MELFFLCALLGYSANYDGYEDHKHYFHFSTPDADYGFVVNDNLNVYCDMVSFKKSDLK